MGKMVVLVREKDDYILSMNGEMLVYESVVDAIDDWGADNMIGSFRDFKFAELRITPMIPCDYCLDPERLIILFSIQESGPCGMGEMLEANLCPICGRVLKEGEEEDDIFWPEDDLIAEWLLEELAPDETEVNDNE